MTELPEGLRAWAALPGPALVLDAIRRRVHRGGGLERGSLTVLLTAEQRRQVGRLLGGPWEVSDKAVTLRALAGALTPHQLTVRQFVELLYGGPLPVRAELVAAQHLAAQDEHRAVFRTLHTVGLADEIIEGWLTGVRAPRLGSGRAVELAAQIAVVWPLLPWTGPGKRLGQLAAEATGNAHALDYATELGRTVARLIAATTGSPPPRRPGRQWRAAWSSGGVHCDTVSSRVLTLNVPLDITAGHRRGVPTWLTLRDLLGPWRFDPIPAQLFVCENPTIIEAAADELGERCPPLVCTDGVPALAALDLLAGASETGIAIHARADIDPAGFVIVATVRSAAPNARLWRFNTPTYATHLGIEVAEGVALADAHEQYGTDVHEEAILALLLDDLRSAVDYRAVGSSTGGEDSVTRRY